MTETRFGTITNGVFDPLTALGGSLIQSQGIGVEGACTFVGEVAPPEATIRAGRRTTPLLRARARRRRAGRDLDRARRRRGAPASRRRRTPEHGHGSGNRRPRGRQVRL